MIIACTSCPAQYSIPDAKIRGKKVRITCKHCAAAIIVDATRLGSDAPSSDGPAPVSPATRREPSVPKPPAAASEPIAAESVAAPLPFSGGALGAPFRLGGLGGGDSIHEEPTVIGRIPREALEYERLFAKKTEPPPAKPSAEQPPAEEPAAASLAVHVSTTPTVRPSASLPEVPESSIDETKRASPQAFRASATPPVPKAAPPKAGADVPTLVSRRPGDLSPGEKAEAPRRSRTLLVLGLLVVVLILVFVSQRLR